MCGRFMLFADYGQILERFDVDVAFDEEGFFFVEKSNVIVSQEPSIEQGS